MSNAPAPDRSTPVSDEIAVDIRSVTKRFGDRTIFEDVTLPVHRGEVVAVIGPSGAGKSTLIRCVNALTPFERGTISLVGQTLHGTEDSAPGNPRRALRELRTHVGMVFQTFNLFPHLSVLDNVTLAPVRVLGKPRKASEDRARELLQTMGLTHRSDAYPKRLSGGEQQRVAICRALAMDPQIMLFDEPTSMLDPEMVGEVLDAIARSVGGGMTTMLVTHEMQFAREVADTVAVMADGALAEVGPSNDVLSNPRTERTRTFLERVLRTTPGAAGVSP